eukprot:748807-Hanusia_phi.AAC.3
MGFYNGGQEVCQQLRVDFINGRHPFEKRTPRPYVPPHFILIASLKVPVDLTTLNKIFHPRQGSRGRGVETPLTPCVRAVTRFSR